MGAGNVIVNGMRAWSGPVANPIDWKKMGCSLGNGSEDSESDLSWCWWLQKPKGMAGADQPFPAGVPMSNGEPRWRLEK